ncbi:HAD family hydrolase [Bosea caraganae]|uniref:phosphoglycolate phosphatase n=1 Tax=Bosea caraganae TaxID=2763117 RepID=A0A370L4E3_9HYPH|nr:HAD family hydrolase [Bosea caraganae]RDJ22333.1 HAD family hydrolase [Bosea caraganae]RDJ23733.1 HAD family hydrolase [Bosea caraganae]
MSCPGAIRGLLFDKDGTLLDYAASWPPINREAGLLAARGDTALATELLRLGGVDPATGLALPDSVLAIGNTLELAEAWHAGGSPLAFAELVLALDALFQGAVGRMVPVCHLGELFGRLHGNGFVLGIASNDSIAAVTATAAHFGIADKLAFMTGYDSGDGAKPEAGMALAFCAATGLDPAEIAMIGDSRHDMEMGRAAGAGLRIGVLTGAGTRETLEPISDLCLDSISELEIALSQR